MTFTVHRVQSAQPAPAPLPEAHATRVWGLGADVRVYVLDSAMAAVWRAVETADPLDDDRAYWTSVERGGGLAGRYHVDPDGQRFIVVTDVLPAPDAPSSAARIDIRAEDWIDIHHAIARRPDLRLLGWYHSHPGMSVRMSYVDRLTQQRTFGVDWQIGLVVDPWSCTFRFHIGPRARRARWVGFVADGAAA
jgi:JAB1/Mov34/MPN/PAD-1 ubiquitin protease